MTDVDQDTAVRAELDAVTERTLADMPGKIAGLVALWGAVIGALVFAASLFFEQVLITPLLCEQMNIAAMCQQGGDVAFHIATVLGSIVGLVGLLRLSIFRPLPVVLAAVATLWGAHVWFVGSYWLEGLLWMAGLYAVAYLLFAQVARVQQFLLALLLLVILVVGVRVALIL